MREIAPPNDAHNRAAQPGNIPPMDLVISNSVYEHLDDVEGITRARIRPEFISGNLADDAVTLIRVAASQPNP